MERRPRGAEAGPVGELGEAVGKRGLKYAPSYQIGPKADGTLVAEQVERLRAVGD